MSEASTAVIEPPAIVVVVGLGQMGLPMANRLIGAGFTVHGLDPTPAACAALEAKGGKAFADPAAAVDGAAAIITMLPNGKIVRDALLGAAGFARRLPRGTLIIDMSSSAPTETISLGAELEPLGLPLIDAPVSGGVKRAIDGSLAIMAGGPGRQVERGRAILEAMGKSVFPTGPLGSGHAMKALNNYVSAAGLIAASEALLVGRTFGLEPDTIIDVLNASTGRNNSTEVKMKQFVISESYASGFSLALMAKDLRIAADLAGHLKLDIPQIGAVADIWDEAKAALEGGADHTAIYRFLAKDAGGAG
ncbi:NAD(P)-dependent oxidoreductase [Phreatobacter stygius]|uniref:NAD(P)-dependent oxidoreductase n=1 Tax=Phreatobacter stygius TaxID=1940610 RepID=A0A4D7BHI6_9HYPH|nr:NAD(P)-dependent oxidoreductase [Phreatobacter stygius]QCI67332.1 NAD(P)-dependent oxidoreductase [Phreatobacter stygius]